MNKRNQLQWLRIWNRNRNQPPHQSHINKHNVNHAHLHNNLRNHNYNTSHSHNRKHNRPTESSRSTHDRVCTVYATTSHLCDTIQLHGA